MKVERIYLRNVHAHGETDWSPNGAKLVALVGPNGVGKSTLASDALRYALFGELREGPDHIVRLGQTEAAVVVEFAYAGERYRVSRLRTTKAGGKTSLELAIADGDAWRPLTREAIRDTQAAIVELLRMDAATFDAAVVLSQGRIMALAEATPAERKRVLGQVLGLELYERAEAQAREQARDLEARVKADRDMAVRLEDDVADAGEGLKAELAQGRARLAELDGLLATNETATTTAQNALSAAEAAAASIRAIAEQAAALERERADLGNRWRTERGHLEEATAEIARLEGLRTDTAGVDEAAAALPAAKAELEQLVAGEAEERRLSTEIQAAHRAILDLERPHELAVEAYRVRHAAAAARVAELEAHTRAGGSVCVTCGQAIDDAKALEQLTAARGALRELGEQPVAPIAIMRAEAGKHRLEVRYDELAWDPTALVAARDRVAVLERLAARAEAIAAAGASIDRERARITDIEAELGRITERGRAVSTDLGALAPRLEQAPALEAAVASARKALTDLGVGRTALSVEARSVERGVATRAAQLQALEAKAAEASAIRTRLAGDELETSRLRRLVEAFGVKGIPARIIAGALPELEASANELLAELRPGMTVAIESQRAKKSGDGVIEALDLVVRDEVGERPFAMFSGGERMSIALAFSIGLSRLAARRAGARIGSLVIDEPDGLDAERRQALGRGLRAIANRGDLERIVVVTHTPDLADLADETYAVSKGPDGSHVELIA